MARVLLKIRFPLAIIVPGKCGYILTFPHCTRAKYPYRRFPLVSPGSPLGPIFFFFKYFLKRSSMDMFDLVVVELHQHGNEPIFLKINIKFVCIKK